MKKISTFVTGLLMGILFIASAFAEIDLKINDPTFNSASFANVFADDDLELELIYSLPGVAAADEIDWLSVSPQGHYLLGWRSDVGFVLYDVQHGILDIVASDYSGDEFDLLDDQLRRCLRSRAMRVIWSSDEMRFTLIQAYTGARNTQNGLMIGDVQTCTIRLMESTESNTHNVYQACFGEDGKLYYGVYEKENKKYSLMEYDFETQENKFVIDNEWSVSSSGYSGEICSKNDVLVALPDGGLLQVGFSQNRECMSWRVLRLVDSEWKYGKSTIYAEKFNNNKQFSSIATATIANGDYVIVNFLMYNGDSYAVVCPVDELAANKWSEDVQIWEAANAILSPDGQYMLLLPKWNNTYRASGRFLSVIDLKNGTERKIANGKVFAKSTTTMSANPTESYRILGEGMQWGGNYLLLAYEGGVGLYRFSSVNPQSASHKNAEVARTSWLNSEEGVRIVFLPNGTINMEMIDYQITVNMPYSWKNGTLTLLIDKDIYVNGVHDYTETLLAEPKKTSCAIRNGTLYLVNDSESVALEYEGQVSEEYLSEALRDEPKPDAPQGYAIVDGKYEDIFVDVGTTRLKRTSKLKLKVSDYDAITEIVIPEQIKSISEMFYSMDNLERVVIPSGVEMIGTQAFSECKRLACAIVPESVIKIDSTAFSGCPNLVLTVVPGSYAETFAKEMDIPYTYGE